MNSASDCGNEFSLLILKFRMGVMCRVLMPSYPPLLVAIARYSVALRSVALGDHFGSGASCPRVKFEDERIF